MPGMAQEPDPRVLRRDQSHPVPRSIPAAAIDGEHLHVDAISGAGTERGQALTDVIGFLVAGDDDGERDVPGGASAWYDRIIRERAPSHSSAFSASHDPLRAAT